MTTLVAKVSGAKRILIADDHPLVREGLIRLINRQPDLDCCGQADNALATQKAVDTLQPDLLVLDLRLGYGDSLELVKSLKARFPNLLIVIISQHDETLYAERALRAGARGYIMKEVASEQVIDAIRTVIRGDIHLSRKMSVLLLQKTLDPVQRNPGFDLAELSDRELHIFHLIGAGLSTQRIAETLHLSPKTIETYRENIKRKLNLANANELLRAANTFVNGT